MGRANLSLCFLSFMVFMSVCSSSRDLLQAIPKKPWCIAQLKATTPGLQQAIKDYCSNVDCRAINPGGSCYNPNTLLNHASYALDAHYRATGDCPSDIGTPAFNDPSFGDCHYP